VSSMILMRSIRGIIAAIFAEKPRQMVDRDLLAEGCEVRKERYLRIYARVGPKPRDTPALTIPYNKRFHLSNIKLGSNAFDRKHEDPANCRTLGWLVIDEATQNVRFEK